MKTKILLAFTSTHGSTQEIAAAIAETMRECGAEVDLQQIGQVKNLDGYDAVILGAPIYMFHWHKAAIRFLSKHQKKLAGNLPVAIFAGGPTGAGDEDEWQDVRVRFDRELATFSWFNPVAVEIVGGKFDPTTLRFPWNLLPALKQMPATDLRDWEAIRTWARGLMDRFQPAGSFEGERLQ